MLDNRQSTYSTKSVNAARVYQSTPGPPSDSNTSPPTQLNLPEPAICQPISVPRNKGMTLFSTAAPLLPPPRSGRRHLLRSCRIDGRVVTTVSPQRRDAHDDF